MRREILELLKLFPNGVTVSMLVRLIGSDRLSIAADLQELENEGLVFVRYVSSSVSSKKYPVWSLE